MTLVAHIYTGHRISLDDGSTFEVRGTRKIRKDYRYILRNVATGEVASIRRGVLLELQREGRATVSA